MLRREYFFEKNPWDVWSSCFLILSYIPYPYGTILLYLIFSEQIVLILVDFFPLLWLITNAEDFWSQTLTSLVISHVRNGGGIQPPFLCDCRRKLIDCPSLWIYLTTSLVTWTIKLICIWASWKSKLIYYFDHNELNVHLQARE